MVGRCGGCGSFGHVGNDEHSGASVRGAAGDADRVAAGRRPAGASGAMPSGPFLDETVDALLLRAVLGPARQADAVSFGFATAGLRRVFDHVDSLLAVGLSIIADRFDGRLCRGGRVSGGNTQVELAAGPAARLARCVCLGLGLSLALHLLQATLLAQWCTHVAAAFLADAAALVSEGLPFLFRQLRFALVHPIGRVHPGALPPLV